MGVLLGGMGESYGDGGEKAESCLSRKVVREFALEAGFSEAGLVALPYEDGGRDGERFEDWVRTGRAGTMGYLKRTGEDGGCCGRGWGMRSRGRGRRWFALRTMRVRSRGQLMRLRKVWDGLRGMRGRAVRMRTGCGGPAIITRC